MAASGSVAMTCLVCGSHFRGTSGSCPACHAEAESVFESAPFHPMLEALQRESQAAFRNTPLPAPVPWAAIAVGGVASAVVAFIAAWIQWETGYWLILAFPAAIGFIGGVAALLMTVREQRVVRAYTVLVPVVIGVAAFASTFWWEYRSIVNDLEADGYINVRENLPFGTYLEIKASMPVNISRRGAEYEGGPGNSGGNYTLWAIEAAAAGIGGYLGWRKALAWLHEQARAND